VLCGVCCGVHGCGFAQENYFIPGRRGCTKDVGKNLPALCDESAPYTQDDSHSEVCAWYGALQYALLTP